MKKLLIFTLILALILPAAATMEEEIDPIVGCWYSAVDQQNLEEDSRIRGVSVEVRVLYFDPSGVIKVGIIAFGNATGLSQTRDMPLAGTWAKKEDGKYATVYENIISESFIENDVLYIPYEKGAWLAYRRIIPLTKQDIRK